MSVISKITSQDSTLELASSVYHFLLSFTNASRTWSIFCETRMEWLCLSFCPECIIDQSGVGWIIHSIRSIKHITNLSFLAHVWLVRLPFVMFVYHLLGVFVVWVFCFQRSVIEARWNCLYIYTKKPSRAWHFHLTTVHIHSFENFQGEACL